MATRVGAGVLGVADGDGTVVGSVWLQFCLSAAGVIAAGVALAKSAEIIAEKGRLGGLWVGSILLAGATSLPEMATSVSASWMGIPDIAVGNVFGSNLFNIFIIAVADLLDGRGSILRKASPGHMLAALFGIILSGMGAVAILVPFGLHVGGVGLDTMLIAVVYLLGVRMLGRFERRAPEDQPHFEIESGDGAMARWDGISRLGRQWSLQTAYVVFAFASVVTVVAGVQLSRTGDAIATSTGLGATFVGSILIAAATSLPEVVTTLAAVMAGSFDLAVGNVLGSNMFNMLILLLADVSYRGGPILAAVQQTHVVINLMGGVLSAIVVIGLFYRSKRTYGRLGPDSVAIVLTYGMALVLLYTMR